MSIPRSDLTHGGVAISSMQASALDQLIVSFGGTPPALLADKVTSALSLKAGHLRSRLDDGTVISATLTHSALNAAIVAAGGTATGTSPVKTTKVSQLLDLRSSLAYVAPPPDGGGVGEGGGRLSTCRHSHDLAPKIPLLFGQKRHVEGHCSRPRCPISVIFCPMAT